jgi:hypothetical protein
MTDAIPSQVDELKFVALKSIGHTRVEDLESSYDSRRETEQGSEEAQQDSKVTKGVQVHSLLLPPN